MITPKGGCRAAHQAGVLFLLMLGAILATLEARAQPPRSEAGLPPEIIRFIEAKEQQGRELAKDLGLNISPEIWAFFATSRTGSVATVTNAFERLKKRAGQYEGSTDDPTVGTTVWQAALEVELAVEAFARDTQKFSLAFGRSVINSIPPGSIYFGGTDPGRGVITALSTSHSKGEPFFTVTQNALADERYLEYLRVMYGGQIHTPTSKESTKAFQDYLADAQKRLTHDRDFPDQPRLIKPGEDVRVIDNRVQVSGQVAVMAINGLLAKVIFDANPEREFYIEESFPLDWMYPYLSPHGLILKLHREPLPGLSEKILKKDREFWLEQQRKLIGGWLRPETPVQEVCSFIRETFEGRDFSNFEGDPQFVEQGYANKLYSKLRSSIGGLYAWRAAQPQSAEEKQPILAEADFAFRQAFALCPYSPEASFRYVNFLVSTARLDDASRVAGTAQSLDPDNRQLEHLASQIDRMRRNQGR